MSSSHWQKSLHYLKRSYAVCLITRLWDCQSNHIPYEMLVCADFAGFFISLLFFCLVWMFAFVKQICLLLCVFVYFFHLYCYIQLDIFCTWTGSVVRYCGHVAYTGYHINYCSTVVFVTYSCNHCIIMRVMMLMMMMMLMVVVVVVVLCVASQSAWHRMKR